MWKVIPGGWSEQLGCWFRFLSEQSVGGWGDKAGQKQSEEFGLRCVTFQTPIRRPGKQLNRVALSREAAVHRAGRGGFSRLSWTQQVVIQAHLPCFLPSPPPLSKEIDFTLQAMPRHFPFK